MDMQCYWKSVVTDYRKIGIGIAGLIFVAICIAAISWAYVNFSILFDAYNVFVAIIYLSALILLLLVAQHDPAIAIGFEWGAVMIHACIVALCWLFYTVVSSYQPSFPDPLIIVIINIIVFVVLLPHTNAYARCRERPQVNPIVPENRES